MVMLLSCDGPWPAWFLCMGGPVAGLRGSGYGRLGIDIWLWVGGLRDWAYSWEVS